VELRVSDAHCINYTNEDESNLYISAPLCYTLFRYGTSYYVYIDGVPYYMPYTVFCNLQVKDGFACSNEGKEMFPVNWEPGVYLVNMETHLYLKKTTRRADSFQQIQINLNSMVTTSYLLTQFPKLEGDAKPIPFPHVVEIVNNVDTRKDTCQVLSCEVNEMDNRKKVFLSYISRCHFESMMTGMGNSGIIVGNTRYAPFQGHFIRDLGMYGGNKYVRYRTGEELIVIKGMKPHHLNGTWHRCKIRKRVPVNRSVELVADAFRHRPTPSMYVESVAVGQLVACSSDDDNWCASSSTSSDPPIDLEVCETVGVGD